jgi:hypothetical protein
MASDVVLVLRSEHRDLLILADRCRRMSRGFQDPEADLRGRLQAHVAAVDVETCPVLRSLSAADLGDLRNAVTLVGAALGDESVGREELAQVVWGLVEAERSDVMRALVAQLPIAERRRAGKVFRMRRDAVLRAEHSRHHRQRSQTELYELARRAGVEHRSTMNQAQLQAAVARWEGRRDHGIQATG